MRLYVGCAMWAHKAWIGDHLPAGRGAQLPAYATWCNAVEGNATFYAAPAPATVATWADQTPDDFRFLFKLPRTLTHERRLRVSAADVGAFTALLQPLGARADTIAVQLPASFGPDDLPALAAFARTAPTSHRFALEVRHPAFFDGTAAGDALAAILRDAGMEWTVFDTTTLFERRPVTDAERAAWTDKPRVVRRTVALTDRPVVRYLGRDDVESTRRGWQPWVRIVAEWLLAGSTPTVFIHTPDNVDALTLARRFHTDVRRLVPALEPLPAPAVLDAQATLF
jgi:uncharacterized protein YecE (DUF72 family)